MINEISRFLRRFVAPSSRREAMESRDVRRLRAALIGIRQERLCAVAEAEGLAVDELADALTVMAESSTLTLEDALLLVERRGLAAAQAMIEGGDA